MQKEELIKILNEIFTNSGFNKKGDSWLIKNNDIIKTIKLQKSKYGNQFYINYGYTLKSIPLNNLSMHIFKGFGSADIKVQEKITSLLDLDDRTSIEDRAIELKELLAINLLNDILKVNTEVDISNELKKGTINLNSVPLVVKNYFNLI